MNDENECVTLISINYMQNEKMMVEPSMNIPRV